MTKEDLDDLARLDSAFSGMSYRENMSHQIEDMLIESVLLLLYKMAIEVD